MRLYKGCRLSKNIDYSTQNPTVSDVAHFPQKQQRARHWVRLSCWLTRDPRTDPAKIVESADPVPSSVSSTNYLQDSAWWAFSFIQRQLNGRLPGNLACGLRYVTIIYESLTRTEKLSVVSLIWHTWLQKKQKYIKIQTKTDKHQCPISPVQVQDTWRQSTRNQKDYRGKDLWNR